MLLLQGSVELMSPSSHVHVRTDLQPKDPFAWAPCGRTQLYFLHGDIQVDNVVSGHKNVPVSQPALELCL